MKKFPARDCETVPKILGVLDAAWDAYTKEHRKEPAVIVMPFWALMSYGKFLGDQEHPPTWPPRTLCYSGVPVTAPRREDAEQWEDVLWVGMEEEKP